MTAPAGFAELLDVAAERRGLPAEEVVQALLPLMRQVHDTHSRGKVAPLEGLGAVQLADGHLYFEQAAAAEPRRNAARLRLAAEPSDGGVEVVDEKRLDSDGPGLSVASLRVGEAGQLPEKPAYMPAWVTWEHLVGHHDALTDVLSLGLLLASLACGLDLGSRDDLQAFVECRENLFQLRPDLHPVLARLIVRATELDRHKRAQDLPALMRALAGYREQELGGVVDPERLAGFRTASHQGRRGIVLAHLRQRLFEITRRNRLIYFRPSLGAVNLTEVSVPLLLDVRHIKREQLFLWHGEIAAKLIEGEPVNLGSWLRFREDPYLAGMLDRIRQESARDRREFGFSQLRLVLAWLRWHNLKEAPGERITSPLLLLPVELVKKKGVRDTWLVQASSSEAEVNPALRQYLKDLYGLALPEAIDLKEAAPADLHRALEAQIRASEPGVTLTLLDRPRIELIWESARRRLDGLRRRLPLSGRGVRTSSFGIDYSYARESFQPLGLQLYLRRVRPSHSPFDEVVREQPRPRLPLFAGIGLEPGPDVRQRQVYALKEGSAHNPYVWDLDLSGLTLGNFNYRKMSLVRDFDRLLESEAASGSFGEVFRLEPRPSATEEVAGLDPGELISIVATDPTQASAIVKVREGGSVIIQGPPGTGKSQTITNLIADLVGAGRRVLFVCEKRAALDVVYHRLRQAGLERLVCLVHDSQSDKKELVSDLKTSYQAMLQAGEDDTAEAEREAAIAALRAEGAVLQRFARAHSEVRGQAGVPLGKLLERLVELGAARPKLEPMTAELLPPYEVWQRWGAAVTRLGTTLADLGDAPVWAAHPLRHLHPDVANSDEPWDRLASRLARARQAAAELETSLPSLGLDPATLTLAEASALAAWAVRTEPVARLKLLGLLEVGSAASEQWEEAAARLRRRRQELAKAEGKAGHWKVRLSPADTVAALAQARSLESSPLRLVSPAWWRLGKVMASHYDLARHAVAPSFVTLLEGLATEHKARAALEVGLAELAERHGLDDPEAALELVAAAREAIGSLPGAVKALALGVAASQGRARVGELAARVEALLTAATGLVTAEPEWSLATLGATLAELERGLPQLPELLPVLAELAQAPAALRSALRTLPLHPNELEGAIAFHSLALALREDRSLVRFDGRMLAQHVARLGEAWDRWLALGARVVAERVRRRFAEHVRISSLPAGQLDAASRELKRRYAAGRRELEHEVSKVMRFRSIRDMVASPMGQVIADLKPVFLMSPLAVADVLPLEAAGFDVVIFDEASQVRVEEAVPSLYRAPQVVVVGDEMQLPPTNFFSAARSGDDELTLDDGDEAGELDLSSDSLLAQAARALPRTLLGWHYRSRSEALIAFSNAAFYAGELLTVPDVAAHAAGRGEVEVSDVADGTAGVEALVARSISFHYVSGGVYERRRNLKEAAYIAQLLRELLARETGCSLGVVAFSEAQQEAIEQALARLASEDEAFRDRLEREYEREEDGQLVGLFVKNLENVQGDERDVIIVSVCYGYDPVGRMLQSFGPINRNGGEKRLNVIFSRARRHMVVVSSIRHADITNEYNDGANCLRGYLEYAEAVSRGDQVSSRRVLDLLTPRLLSRAREGERRALATELAQALIERGYEVVAGAGTSKLRCDLAVKRPGEREFRLGVLLDRHEPGADVLERYLLRPRLLEAFGWRTVIVPTRDWIDDPERVMTRLERAAAGGEHEEPEAEEPEVAPAHSTEAKPTAAPEPSRLETAGSVEAAAQRVASAGQAEATAAPPTPGGLAPRAGIGAAAPEIAPAAASGSLEPAPVPTREERPPTIEPEAGQTARPAAPLPAASPPVTPPAPPAGPAPHAAVHPPAPTPPTVAVPVLPPSALAAPAGAHPGLPCYLELSEGAHHKFWRVDVQGMTYVVTFGRIGTRGQTQIKSFTTVEEAVAEAHHMADSKRRKGYREPAG
ncbi:MAG: WGR domain-containing protein [Micrococcales bacterium]|nr:WGR domain-containing protein [Micrococcales bacterium]